VDIVVGGEKEQVITMINPIQEILAARGGGASAGIYSVCSANEHVLEAVLETGKETGTVVLIEATANQCNQFGGYTGMTPEDFACFVYDIACKTGFDDKKLILGGDHLGPLTWSGEPEHEAMEKAEELIRQCVLAGFSKIHIDTSMRLKGDDDKLTDDLIAARAARLATVSEKAFAERIKSFPESPLPVYVIGSEVPVPGGTAEEEGLVVTSPEHFEATLEAFKSAFSSAGLQDAFNRVVGVVVQPGVEFSGEHIDVYDRTAARNLTGKLREYPGLIFEGHSSDYQTREKLREMVEDGIAILKVGPALTFYMREALFALVEIEKELELSAQSGFKDILENVMLSSPGNWNKYYHGNEQELRFKRKYSLLDRSRYYMSDDSVKKGIANLIRNINSSHVPESVISQYLPTAHFRLRAAGKEFSAENLIKARVRDCIEDYLYAIGG